MGIDDERVRQLWCDGAFEIIEKPVRSEDIREVLSTLEREVSGAGRIH